MPVLCEPFNLTELAETGFVGLVLHSVAVIAFRGRIYPALTGHEIEHIVQNGDSLEVSVYCRVPQTERLDDFALLVVKLVDDRLFVSDCEQTIIRRQRQAGNFFEFLGQLPLLQRFRIEGKSVQPLAAHRIGRLRTSRHQAQKSYCNETCELCPSRNH